MDTMTILLVLCGMLAVGLVLVGIFAMIEPHRMAHLYGVPIEGLAAAGFVRATGIRDIAFGCMLGAATYFREVP